MSLSAGKKLSHYEVLEPIGRGGMGEVFRARDTKLERDVAIKTLPEAFARDPERLSRFEREARLLASLNHPHIATLYGLEESDGQPFLVMELVDGETLQERVRRAPVPVGEAVPLFTRIAEGLEAAHDRGIVHRDLKPANVKITPDGSPKILDFGLAKAFTEDGDVSEETSPSQSPTMTRGTAEGVILGTASYMSPEQARGHNVDRRADVWAFGCCLFEALTATKAFSGDTVTDVLASVVGKEPAWEALPSEATTALRDLLERCLRKDAKRRIQHVGDARIVLEEVSLDDEKPSPSVASRPNRPWALAALAVLFGLAGWLRPADRGGAASSAGAGVVRFDVRLDQGSLAWARAQETAQFDITHDGRRIAYVASDGDSRTRRLYVRNIDSVSARLLPGTEGALNPFFSPDGDWIGFFTSTSVRKIAVAGDAPVSLGDVSPVHRGASWGVDDTILFAYSYSSAIFRVPADGGVFVPLTRVDHAGGESGHSWPQWLPDGRRFLFTVWRGGDFDEAAIAVGDVTSGEHRIVLDGGAHGRYVPSGHLLFGREGNLMAVGFDVDIEKIDGLPVPVFDELLMNPSNGAAQFAVSETGTLVHTPDVRDPGRMGGRHLWVDRTGATEPVSDARGAFNYSRLAPDGRRLATQLANDVWLHDLERGSLQRVTFQAVNLAPAWTRDGSRLAFASSRLGVVQIYWMPADGGSAPQRLSTAQSAEFPGSFAPDGTLAYSKVGVTEHGPTSWSIWESKLGDDEPRPLVQGTFNAVAPAYSPDGKWLAYASDESGRQEIFVQPYPPTGPKWQVSTNGGAEPLWNPRGGELFYRDGEHLLAVAITTEPSFEPSRPVALFEDRFSRMEVPPELPEYDVSPDGGRFLMIDPGPPPVFDRIRVTLNWFDELRAVASGESAEVR